MASQTKAQPDSGVTDTLLLKTLRILMAIKRNGI